MVLVCLFAALLSSTSSAQSLPRGRVFNARPAERVRIEVLELRPLRDPSFAIRVGLSGLIGGRPLQVLIFTQDEKSGSFRLAIDQGAKGPPRLPKLSSAAESTAEWTTTFVMPFGRPTVYAVACEVSDRAKGDWARELGALSRLPYGEATSIDQVLRLLAEFDWRPVGYTYVKPS